MLRAHATHNTDQNNIAIMQGRASGWGEGKKWGHIIDVSNVRRWVMRKLELLLTRMRSVKESGNAAPSRLDNGLRCCEGGE